MKMLFGFIFMVAFSTAIAQEMCDTEVLQGLKTYRLNKVPNYFFRMSPDGKYLYYISSRKNWHKDLTTGKETQLPGDADPVPSADGDVLTYVSLRMDGSWDVGVTRIKDGKPDLKKKAVIAKAQGSYQSVGLLDSKGGRPFFYYNDNQEKLVLRNLSSKEGIFELSEEKEILKGNEFRLPMLSPDGTKFSVLNLELNKTQIYSLNPETMQATLLDTLPVGGGKASFSYDGNKVTFHLTKSREKNIDHFYPESMTAKGEYRNIYSYDLRSKKITQVTDNVSSSSYFPFYLKDGRIAYLDKPINSEVFSLKVMMSPETSKKVERSFESVESCFGNGTAEELKRLGDLWGQICKRWYPNDDDTGIALTAGLNMSVANCKTIAEKQNDPSLLLICDALDGKKIESKHSSNLTRLPISENPGKKLFQNRCAICHEGNQELLKNSPTFEERIGGKTSKRMPPMGPLLSTAEVKLLKQYLSDFMQSE